MTELTAGNLDSTDFIVAYDASAGTDKKVPADEIFEPLLSTFGKTLVDDATAAAFMTTLGISAIGQTLIDDADAAAVLTSLGIDTDLLTLAVQSNVSVDTYAATWGDDADADALRTTINICPNWTYDTQTATTSAGPIEISTSIPSDAVEVEIFLDSVSADAAGYMALEVGHSGGWETSGYEGGLFSVSTAIVLEEASTSNFYFTLTSQQVDGSTFTGIIRLHRWDASEHLWFCTINSLNTAGSAQRGAGSITLSGALSKLRLTDGAASFDAGEARVRYRSAV
ncbi:MAG: hypothetical protein ACXABY_10030 [Candidatus Thorarchaeota archaeon]